MGIACVLLVLASAADVLSGHPLNWKARVRLMRKRWYVRWRRGIVYALMSGTLFMLMKWAGLRGKVDPWGNPIPFVEALPAFPLAAVFGFVTYVLWPWHDVEDDHKSI
jgi:hypothetical protein